MKWELLLGIGALYTNVCAAVDHNKLMQDQGKALWQDLKAGKVAQDPALPLLTKEGRKYAAKVMDFYAKEENTFSKLESVLLHGEHDQKKWNQAVDQWVHDFEEALHSRPLPSSQNTAVSEFISTTKKVLHAINEVDGTDQKLASGLDVRQSVGILLSDLIESLRVEVSPYGPEQNPHVEKANMDNLRQRQLQMVTIVRGILEQIPAAFSLLDDAVIDIVGRNEKERGKEYFMKHYAPKTKNGASKKTIKHINGLYKDQQRTSLGDKEKRYFELMNGLLGRLEQSNQKVPEQHHAAIVSDLNHPAHSEPSIGRPKDVEASVFVPHTESALVASGTSNTSISSLTAFVTPPATIAIALNSTNSANSTSTIVLSDQNVDAFITTVQLIVTVTEPVNRTMHPTVTATELSATTVQHTVTGTATGLSRMVDHSIAYVSATSMIHHLGPRGYKQERKEKDDHDHDHKKEIAIALGTGLPIFTAGTGWAAYKIWKKIDYLRRMKTIQSAAQTIQEAANLIADQLALEKASAVDRIALEKAEAVDRADQLALEKANTYDNAYNRFLGDKRARKAMKRAERLGQLKHLKRMGGDLYTIAERSPSAETGSYHTAAEEIVGQVAQLTLNEAGRDLARAGQLTESAVANLGKGVPNLVSWLLDQTDGMGEEAFEVVKEAIVASHVRGVRREKERWSDVGTGTVGTLSDDTDIFFEPAVRMLQGMSEDERLKAFEEDVEQARRKHGKSDSSDSDSQTDSPQGDDKSRKESATTRPLETPKPTESPQPSRTGLKAPGQGDNTSAGSDATSTILSSTKTSSVDSSFPTDTSAASTILSSTKTSLVNLSFLTGTSAASTILSSTKTSLVDSSLLTGTSAASTILSSTKTSLVDSSFPTGTSKASIILLSTKTSLVNLSFPTGTSAASTILPSTTTSLADPAFSTSTNPVTTPIPSPYYYTTLTSITTTRTIFITGPTPHTTPTPTPTPSSSTTETADVMQRLKSGWTPPTTGPGGRWGGKWTRPWFGNGMRVYDRA